jgi:hypothetical protein
VRRRARGQEDVEIGEPRRPQARVAGRRRLLDRVDGLPRTVVAGRRQPRPDGIPQLADG